MSFDHIDVGILLRREKLIKADKTGIIDYFIRAFLGSFTCLVFYESATRFFLRLKLCTLTKFSSGYIFLTYLSIYVLRRPAVDPLMFEWVTR